LPEDRRRTFGAASRSAAVWFARSPVPRETQGIATPLASATVFAAPMHDAGAAGVADAATPAADAASCSS
jgi:hypothetical protein